MNISDGFLLWLCSTVGALKYNIIIIISSINMLMCYNAL